MGGPFWSNRTEDVDGCNTADVRDEFQAGTFDRRKKHDVKRKSDVKVVVEIARRQDRLVKLLKEICKSHHSSPRQVFKAIPAVPGIVPGVHALDSVPDLPGLSEANQALVLSEVVAPASEQSSTISNVLSSERLDLGNSGEGDEQANGWSYD